MWIIKVGGGKGNALFPVLDELAEYWHQGQPWVLVHGGSARTDQVATALGHPPRSLTSPSGYVSRYTDRQTALLLTMVYGGEINKRIVERLQALGVDAFGCTGLDGRLLQAKRKQALVAQRNGRRHIVRDTYTGTLQKVRGDLLRLFLDQGLAPVICPPAIGQEHEILNVDGDRVAAAVAVALGAEQLVLLTGAPGLLSAEDGRTIPRLTTAQIPGATERHARGRMRLKLKAASEALAAGVRRVVLGASDIEHPISAALAGRGTLLEAEP